MRTNSTTPLATLPPHAPALTLTIAAACERDLRGGTWERVLASIAAARNHVPGDRMILSMVTHRDNVRELPELVRLAHRFGVTRVAATLMIASRPAAIRQSLWFDKALANELIEEAREVGRELGVQVEAPSFSPIATRAAPHDVALADLDAHVTPWLEDPATRYGDLPRFSVVLPVEDGADPAEAAAALRSLAWQTYPAWECLVAVAGGAEGLPAPLREELARQPKARLVSGGTLPAALEEALRAAGGQAVAALVPGARWHPVKLERLLQELSRDPGPADGVVHGAIDATGRAPRQGCVLRAEAVQARPAEALAALVGQAPAAAAFAVSPIPDRLDVRVPGVGGDRREAWLDAVARRLNLLGEAALEAGDGPAALDAFEAALAADPLRAETHHNLALASRAGGCAPEARLHAQQALRLQPANPVFKATELALRAAC